MLIFVDEERIDGQRSMTGIGTRTEPVWLDPRAFALVFLGRSDCDEVDEELSPRRQCTTLRKLPLVQTVQT
jgi:hypothetical protein